MKRRFPKNATKLPKNTELYFRHFLLYPGLTPYFIFAALLPDLLLPVSSDAARDGGPWSSSFVCCLPRIPDHLTVPCHFSAGKTVPPAKNALRGQAEARQRPT